INSNLQNQSSSKTESPDPLRKLPNRRPRLLSIRDLRFRICLGFGVWVLGFVLALLLSAPQLKAATNPPPGGPGRSVQTNAFRPPQRVPGKTNVIGKAQPRGATTNSVPATQ